MSNHLINQKPWISELVVTALTFDPLGSLASRNDSNNNATGNSNNHRVVRLAQLIQEPHYVNLDLSTQNSKNINIDKKLPIEFVISDGTNTIPVIIPYSSQRYDLHSTKSIVQELINTNNNKNHSSSKRFHTGCLIKLRYFNLGLTSFIPYYNNHISNSTCSTNQNVKFCLIIETDIHQLHQWNNHSTRNFHSQQPSLLLSPCIENVGGEGMGIVNNQHHHYHHSNYNNIQSCTEVKQCLSWLQYDELKINYQILHYYSFYCQQKKNKSDNDNVENNEENVEGKRNDYSKSMMVRIPGSKYNIALFDYFKCNKKNIISTIRMMEVNNHYDNNNDDDDDDDDKYQNNDKEEKEVAIDDQDSDIVEEEFLIVDNDDEELLFTQLSNQIESDYDDHHTTSTRNNNECNRSNSKFGISNVLASEDDSSENYDDDHYDHDDDEDGNWNTQSNHTALDNDDDSIADADTNTECDNTNIQDVEKSNNHDDVSKRKKDDDETQTNIEMVQINGCEEDNEDGKETSNVQKKNFVERVDLINIHDTVVSTEGRNPKRKIFHNELTKEGGPKGKRPVGRMRFNISSWLRGD